VTLSKRKMNLPLGRGHNFQIHRPCHILLYFPPTSNFTFVPPSTSTLQRSISGSSLFQVPGARSSVGYDNFKSSGDFENRSDARVHKQQEISTSIMVFCTSLRKIALRFWFLALLFWPLG